MEKKFVKPRLNIQLFAGENDDNPKDNDDKVDYKALYEKTKAEKDKASKEASDYKKQLKDKMTDDEKKANDELEREKQINEIIKENKRLKLSNSLSKDNVLSNEEIETLVNARYSDNDGEFADALIKLVKSKLEKQKTDITNEYKKNPKLPSGSNDGSKNDDITNMAKEIAKSKTQNQSKKFDTYFGN